MLDQNNANINNPIDIFAPGEFGWALQTNILRSYFQYCIYCAAVEVLTVSISLSYILIFGESNIGWLVLWNILYTLRLIIKSWLQYRVIYRRERNQIPFSETQILRMYPLVEWIFFTWGFVAIQHHYSLMLIKCPNLLTLTCIRMLMFWMVALRPLLCCLLLPILACLTFPLAIVVWYFTPGEGVTDAQLNNIPVYVMGEKDCPSVPEDTCSICLSTYMTGDSFRILPCQGRHIFHKECIDVWLKRKARCPLCRDWIVNPPTEQVVDEFLEEIQIP